MGTETVWLSTFFKISYFVFHRRKCVQQNRHIMHNRFETTWQWVKGKLFIFGWIISLMLCIFVFILHTDGLIYVLVYIIFCLMNTINVNVNNVMYSVVCYICQHGDMDQKDRDLIMREFRSGSSRVLITTDLLVSKHISACFLLLLFSPNGMNSIQIGFI